MSVAKKLKGIQVPHYKTTAEPQTATMKVPAEVRISMAQHIGAPCIPTVSAGDKVCVGQIIGETDAFVSAPIHSSVSGTVESIGEIRSMTGGKDQVVLIKTDRKQTMTEDLEAPEVSNREEFVAAIRKSGLVGLGGAAFPTHIKYAPKNPDEIEALIVNGAECEPFITSDHRCMIEDTQDIIDGIKIVMKYLNIPKVYIAIEENKPDAIIKLREMLSAQGLAEEAEVVELKTQYPQGAERVLVEKITGKTMAAGVLPAALGVMLSNVTTIAFVGKYFRTGEPLVSKRITVAGSGVMEPQNIVVPIGASIYDVVEKCGGYRGKPSKIIMGGPMMGRTVYTDLLPIVKNNNAILVFTGSQAVIPEESECINCGRCYRACPFNLMPYAINRAYENRDIERLEKLNVMQCMECGSCAYVCPARKPLGFINKLGKQLVKEASE